jgi:hypothetical protein
MKKKTYSIEDAIKYLLTWIPEGVDFDAMTEEEIETMYHNARFSVKSEIDGIEAWERNR